MPDEAVKLCECGCGQPTTIARMTNRSRGVVAGQPNRFLPGHYSRVSHEVSEEELQARRPRVAKRYGEGKSLTEIGDELGLSKSQVHTVVVNLRKSGDLLPPARCQAITRFGKRCGSRASANGYCGGHGPKSGRPPSKLPAPVEVLAKRYSSGETLQAIADDTGISTTLLADRLKKAGVKIRARGCQKGKTPWQHDWLKTEEIVRAWNQGLSLGQLSERFGAATSTIWGRLTRDGFGDSSDLQLRRLYVYEELPMWMVAEYMGCSAATVLRRLRTLGIDTRNGRTRRRSVAVEATIRQIQRAAEGRAAPSDDFTEKQTHLLNILRASPRPLPANRVALVARGIPRRWSGVGRSEITACLRRLEARGFVSSVVDAGAGHFRGREVLVWFPATEELAAAKSAGDAARLRELQVLIEEQEHDGQADLQGELGHWADKSIDAPLTEDGLTILDTLESEGDVLAEMGQAA